MRELSRKGGEQHGDERRAFAGYCDLQDVSRAGAGACGVAVFRMPYISRLVAPERSEPGVYFACVAHGRALRDRYGTVGCGFISCALARAPQFSTERCGSRFESSKREEGGAAAE